MLSKIIKIFTFTVILAFCASPWISAQETRVVPGPVPEISVISDTLPVSVLSGLLGSETAEIRTRAAEALSRTDTSAVPALLDALKDKNIGVRAQVILSLGELGDTQAVPALLTVLGEKDNRKDNRAKKSAIDALGELKDLSAIPALIKIISKHRDVELRVYAAYALGNIGSPAVPALLKSLRGASKMYAAIALGKVLSVIRDTSVVTLAIPALIKALNDRDDGSRKEIALVLRKLGKPAVKALSDVLGDRGRSAAERGYMAEALGILGDTSAIPVLLEMLDENNEELKGSAAGALTRMGKSAVDKAGKKLVEGAGSFEKKLANVLFLARYGDERSMEFLTKLLNYEAYRQQATQVLERDFGGKVRKEAASKKVICPACLGGGTCPGCGGSGKITDPTLFILSCEWCGGTGVCPVCKGEGNVKRLYYKYVYSSPLKGNVSVGDPVIESGQ